MGERASKDSELMSRWALSIVSAYGLPLSAVSALGGVRGSKAICGGVNPRCFGSREPCGARPD